MNADLRGQLVVVVGYGVSGRASAEVLLAEGAQVRVTEARANVRASMPVVRAS